MPLEIAPALTAEEWENRATDFASHDQVLSANYLVVSDAAGDTVTVSGSNELFALIALANDLLPPHDPRRLTREQVERDSTGELQRVLLALLPPI